MLTFFSDLDLSSICVVTGRSEWPDWIYFHGKLMPSQGEIIIFGGLGGRSVYTRFSDLSCIWDQSYLCFSGWGRAIFLDTWYVFTICARWSHSYFLSEKEFSDDFGIDFQRLWEWEWSIYMYIILFFCVIFSLAYLLLLVFFSTKFRVLCFAVCCVRRDVGMPAGIRGAPPGDHTSSGWLEIRHSGLDWCWGQLFGGQSLHLHHHHQRAGM